MWGIPAHKPTYSRTHTLPGQVTNLFLHGALGGRLANVGGIQISAISAFEIAVLYRKGRIELPTLPDRWYEDVRRHHGLNELPVTGRIAARSAMLPLLHKDPCDRMIVATALENNLRIVTADQTLAGYPGVKILWD